MIDIVRVESRLLDYVSMELVFRAGAALDPPGKEGLTFLMANALLRGTAHHTHEQLAKELDLLGTGIGISVGNESVTLSADCAGRYRQRLAELVAEALVRPRFPADELAKFNRQTVAELTEMKDSDSALASLHFAGLLLSGHVYGHPRRGYLTTVPHLSRKDVTRHYEKFMVRANLFLGVAGAVGPEDEADLVRTAAALPQGEERPDTTLPVPHDGGLRILLVTRPDRTQAQVVMGQLGLPAASPDFLPAAVAITGFGGTFTSPLVREIREKRGWSYGVGASLSPGRYAGIVKLGFTPKNEDVPDAISLALDMLHELQARGIGAKDLRFAQQYLVNQFPFALDTPMKRMHRQLIVKLLNRPADHLDTYLRDVQAITPKGANQCLKRLLRPGSLSIVVVGSESLEEPLRRLPGVSSLRTIPFSWDGPLSG